MYRGIRRFTSTGRERCRKRSRCGALQEATAAQWVTGQKSDAHHALLSIQPAPGRIACRTSHRRTANQYATMMRGPRIVGHGTERSPRSDAP
jgi:hypothetical protein